ncbi:NAD-dependent epimerase/dehydratase family protein [Pseudomonas fluorescens]|uniref:NAD-dependent epimerase/dehydratase family protein n=1 Tax=Pseudomonas fluorescens TaxID=294 RepID=UPI001785C911|nr:NAD-dependent epimerase/dehydratase family protein [Pseudomonas fluorescens]
MKTLLTGATGFVGRSLLLHLHDAGHDCIAVSREVTVMESGVVTLPVGDMNNATDWNSLLDGVECVIHLAARAHLLRDRAADPQQAFDEVNFHATMNLVRQAEAAGVKRFVYVSSIGVHGAFTTGHSFTESSTLDPHSPYAKSKLKAEEGIRRYLEGRSMEWVIVRPPLIYAANAPGNFQLLLRLVETGLPLPFAGVHNARTMVALENIVDFLVQCAVHPRAARQVFVISDNADCSIGKIVETLAQGMGKRVKLFRIPPRVVRWGATLIGRQSTYVQLYESLRVDSTKARSLLDWQPVINTHDALLNAGRLFHFGTR